jgi:GNAT superfamily N-acetyltransferase
MSDETTLPAITIEPIDPRSAEAEVLLDAYLAEIEAAFGYDDNRGSSTNADEFVEPGGCLLIVRDGTGTGVGIGGIRLLDIETAEIKRMFLRSSMRGRGAGWKLLEALEAKAVELGATRGVLDTNETLTPALALYRAAGWQEVAAYNDNLEATHWFAKDLDG